jgi:hypothetical protein
MERSQNPFKPSAGANPPVLVGREALVDEFMESIEDGPGAPGRLTIFSGPRGAGKTVMLNAIADRAAEERQWIAVHETATVGLIERLARQASGILRDWSPASRRVTGVSISGIGGFSLSEEHLPPELDLREALTNVAVKLEENGTGLLITIDEIHAGDQDELRQLAAIAQHLVREEREVALALAGLPQGISALLSGESVATFLRRAEHHPLGELPLPAVKDALRATIQEHGRSIAADALEAAAEASGGYPFMVQLVGYHAWRRADGDVITREIVQQGIEAAKDRLGRLVHGTALKDLSDVDRQFLEAMAADSGASMLADLAERMDRPLNYLAVYRARLLEGGIIRTAGRGAVDFALPFLREYLRERLPR